MSQSGKVLQLYVELRTGPDQNGEYEEARGVSVQDSPAELLSQLTSQTTVGNTTAASCRLQDVSCSPQIKTSPKASRCWGSPVRVPHAASDETRSVVSFSYVEKSNVKTVESPCSSARSRFQKRLSDPVWFGSPDSSCSSSPKLTLGSPGTHQQTFSPRLRQPHLDLIGRAATRRAVEEFGSPLLRIKLAHALEDASSRFNRQPRCQSWAGSPVQCQNVRRHPEYSQDVYWSPLKRFPADPQSPPHVSGEDRVVAGSPASHKNIDRSSSSRGTFLGNNGIGVLNQLSHSKSSSPVRSPEEASRATPVFTEPRGSSTHNPSEEHRSSFQSGETKAQNFNQTLQMNIPFNNQTMPALENPHQPQPPRMDHHAYQETGHQRHQVLSTVQTSPAVPSRVFRPSHPPTEISSPLRDPRLFQAEIRVPDSPTLHRHQPPQYTGDSWSPGPDSTGDLNGFEREDCTELARRLFIHQSVEEAPVSWTSRQQWRNQTEPGLEFGHQPSGKRRRSLSPTARQKRAEQRRRELLLLGPVVLDSDEEEEEDEEGRGDSGRQRAGEALEPERNEPMAGSSSRSSSGVTGSLGDRDCLSPESSQSSHQSNETGAATSGIQVGTGPRPAQQVTGEQETRARAIFIKI